MTGVHSGTGSGRDHNVLVSGRHGLAWHARHGGGDQGKRQTHEIDSFAHVPDAERPRMELLQNTRDREGCARPCSCRPGIARGAARRCRC